MIIQMRAVLTRTAVTGLGAIPLASLDKDFNLLLTTERGRVDVCGRATWNLTFLPLAVLTLLLASSNKSHKKVVKRCQKVVTN